MEANHQQTGQKVKRAPIHEGPKNHFIAFGISIVLTLIAFITVANPSLNKQFIYSIIVIMAIVQVLVQLLFWMHMKDRGHVYVRLFLGLGAFVAFSAFIAAQYWMWW